MQDRYVDLQVKLAEIDQAIHDFASNFPNEFSLHLDFPYARQQQMAATRADGFEKAIFPQTVQAIRCLKHLDESNHHEYIQELTKLLPKLSDNINRFLDALQHAKANQLYSAIEPTCHDVIYQLNFITKNNKLDDQPRPKPNK